MAGTLQVVVGNLQVVAGTLQVVGNFPEAPDIPVPGRVAGRVAGTVVRKAADKVAGKVAGKVARDGPPRGLPSRRWLAVPAETRAGKSRIIRNNTKSR